MSSTSKSGIQVTADGNSYIPSSRRADGSTRKEIRVRPGYRPPEDVETYKNRSAEAWKNRGGVPGTEGGSTTEDTEAKSKNTKRREAAKKRKEAEVNSVENGGLSQSLEEVQISDQAKMPESRQRPDSLTGNIDGSAEAELDRQKKIRNLLKKYRAVQELKEKKTQGEKLTHDQLLKIGKEDELLRDLKKLNYNATEAESEPPSTTTGPNGK